MKNKLTLLLITVLFLISTKDAKAIMVDKMVVFCEDQKIERVLAGDIYKQTFISETDEFGIIAVKFSNFSDISSDVLIFRIKESGQDGWYYENHYKVDQFQNDQYFPFGFPVISNALGKVYVFELESLSGTPDDSIGFFLCEESDDVVFKLVQGAPALRQLTNDVLFRIKSDLGFFILWSLVITVLLFETTKHDSKET